MRAQGDNRRGLLTAERANVRAAWNWAVEHRKIVEINQFMDCL